MSQNNTTGTQGAATVDESATQKDMKAKREMARRLMEGDGVDKDEANAVSLLEDCVAHGDSDAMVILAKCCALGHGMEHNAERAEALVSDAAKKGNHEARILLRFTNCWKGKESIYIWGLGQCFLKEPKKGKPHVCAISTGLFKGECTIERVALVMNIVPCGELCLRGQS